jgi:hypothetical protein
MRTGVIIFGLVATAAAWPAVVKREDPSASEVESIGVLLQLESLRDNNPEDFKGLMREAHDPKLKEMFKQDLVKSCKDTAGRLDEFAEMSAKSLRETVAKYEKFHPEDVKRFLKSSKCKLFFLN